MWRAGLPGGVRAVFGASPLSSGGSPRALEGKVALVTAGTDGIGLGVAEALGVAGAQVLLSSRRAQNVQRAVEHLRGRGLQVSGVTCHVGRAEDRERMVQAALDTFGAIDILVSNAAVNPHLGPRPRGRRAHLGQGVPGERDGGGHVGAAGGAAHGEAGGRGHRGDVIDRRVPANGGAGPVQCEQDSPAGAGGRPEPGAPPPRDPHQRRRPGADPDRFSSALWEDEALREQALRELGVDRLGTPQEVAQAVLFLVSPQAAFVAGQTLLVAGGARPRL
ncbi:dehydrogenase/reductase SDR family member 4-like [Haemorhous mexicanus]|uniref:dehydrogenase/reductase SDR family member 4-like n=1 Tax=Haemorhous mexicanus TaxID=30427 RepID=UPI0028BED3F5|nr:dehydrogenase/reductase SDR family member 4-like [Haemorhous mexicanus]